MNKEPITLNGLQKLKEELIFLKEKKRPEIVAAIAEARSHGDLKENAEYHAAKEQQSLLESRVLEINDTIARANVIDVTKIEEQVLQNVNNYKSEEYSNYLKILKSDHETCYFKLTYFLLKSIYLT